jgi:hypothetical protein
MSNTMIRARIGAPRTSSTTYTGLTIILYLSFKYLARISLGEPGRLGSLWCGPRKGLAATPDVTAAQHSSQGVSCTQRFSQTPLSLLIDHDVEASVLFENVRSGTKSCLPGLNGPIICLWSIHSLVPTFDRHVLPSGVRISSQRSSRHVLVPQAQRPLGHALML